MPICDVNVNRPTLGTDRVIIPGRPAPHFAVRTEVCAASSVIPQQSNDYFQTLLILSGRRIQHLGLRDIEASRGHILFMPPGVPHGATIKTRNVGLTISFNLPFLRPELPIDAMAAWDQSSTLQTVPELLPFVGQLTLNLRCNKQLTSRLCTMGAELEARANSPSLGALTFAKAQLSLLLLEVVQAFEQPLVAAAAHSQRGITTSNRIDELLAFLREHLSQRISINDAASHLHCSCSCLATRIRRVTGKTFSELLFETRLLRAKELLLYSDHRISEIAYSCGFDDHAYFSRRFRQLIGASPVDYRRQRTAPEPLNTRTAGARVDGAEEGRCISVQRLSASGTLTPAAGRGEVGRLAARISSSVNRAERGSATTRTRAPQRRASA
jgi:AraC-like DNA-binding protein/quercetin dioxygenase-like cupin family protein